MHVVDASQPNPSDQIETVQAVLKEINAHTIPQLLVYNKADCLTEAWAQQESAMLIISANTGYGLNQLYEALSHK
jgi:GTPase